MPELSLSTDKELIASKCVWMQIGSFENSSFQKLLAYDSNSKQL